jgi:lipopolysaccharide export system permease protein
LGFKEYKKILDLSSFKMSRTADSAFKDNYKMLSVRQLDRAIDSLENTKDYYYRRSMADIGPYLAFVRYRDSTWQPVNNNSLKKVASFDQLIPDSAANDVYDRVTSAITSIQPSINLMADDAATRDHDLRYHLIEWHRKFTLSIACVVLFLIGAPLGSIIRKGGLGTPLVFAVIFFVIFHLFNTFGEKFVKSGEMSPFSGMWLSTAVLIPVGIFLTYKAMHDSQLFNKEFYNRTLRRVKRLIKNYRREPAAS